MPCGPCLRPAGGASQDADPHWRPRHGVYFGGGAPPPRAERPRRGRRAGACRREVESRGARRSGWLPLNDPRGECLRRRRQRTHPLSAGCVGCHPARRRQRADGSHQVDQRRALRLCRHRARVSGFASRWRARRLVGGRRCSLHHGAWSAPVSGGARARFVRAAPRVVGATSSGLPRAPVVNQARRPAPEPEQRLRAAPAGEPSRSVSARAVVACVAFSGRALAFGTRGTRHMPSALRFKLQPFPLPAAPEDNGGVEGCASNS